MEKEECTFKPLRVTANKNGKYKKYQNNFQQREREREREV